MKSIIDRMRRAATRSTTRRTSSIAESTGNQTPDGRMAITDNWPSTSNVENPLHVPAGIETPPRPFPCGVCENAVMLLREHYDDVTRCSICNQLCGTIFLKCDSCGLCICCSKRGKCSTEDWEWSCCNSYFEPVGSEREQLYNQQDHVSQFSTVDQRRWLQCMWHDIVHNTSTFHTELQHASQVASINDSLVNVVIENLGVEIVQGLVRLFILFHSKVEMEITEWFSSLITHKRELLGSVALETSVRLVGRLEQVKWLMLQLKVDDSNCQLSGIVAIAARMGKLEILEFLLEDVKVDPSAEGNCAMQYASEKGHVNIVERLLQDDRVDPAASDNWAVRCASEKGHLSVVERLLQDVRVDPTADNNYALRYSSWSDRLNVVERLLHDDRVDPSAVSNFAVRYASRSGRLTVVERLLQDDRVDPSAHDNFALQYACQNGFYQVVERLLQDDRVSPSENDNYAIRYASENGHLNVVHRLLRDGRVDPSAVNNYAIRWASRNGHFHVAERLLRDNRVDPSADYNYAVREASRYGHLQVVERLLQDNRVDPSADDNYAVREASRCGHSQVVELLLQDHHRVDPSSDNNYAIRLASKEGHLNIVERLLQDNRVDPAAHEWEAIRTASDDKILKCLYYGACDRVCFVTDVTHVVEKLVQVHNESLVLGGLCLSCINSDKLPPRDVIVVILSEWATLANIDLIEMESNEST